MTGPFGLTARADRCALRSEAIEERLAGTASTIRRWLLIEHAGPWGRDGLRDAPLPAGLGEALRNLERRTRCRVLLIRRPVRADGDGASCFAVDTLDAWVGFARLERLGDAAGIDVADRSAFEPVEGPVVVVCTQGRRDVCCAERGRPLAAAAALASPLAVWESTHVGGDRFAGNVVVFPHGLVYGRVEPERGPELLAAFDGGRIVLDRYRGRTSHPMAAQAADHAVRVRFGLDRIDDVRLLSVERTGDVAHATLGLPDGRASVRLRREHLPAMRLTCASHDDEVAASWAATSVDRTSG